MLTGSLRSPSAAMRVARCARSAVAIRMIAVVVMLGGSACACAMADAPAKGDSAAVGALARMTAAQRANAEIASEPASRASAADRATAALAGSLWNAGAHEAALAAFATLQDPCAVAIGVSWREPAAPGAPPDEGGIAGFGDVTIDVNDAIGGLALELYRPTGMLFCVAQAADGWRLHRSNDGGQTWTTTYSWLTSGDVVDVDMTAVDGYVYIGYTATGSESELRVRRASAASGAIDGPYNFEVAFNAAPATIEEVAAASSADDGDTNVFFAALKSNDTVGYHWDTAADGTTWIHVDVGVTDAERGLDMTYNPSAGPNLVFVSYISGDDNVYVARRQTGTGWSVTWMALYTGGNVDRTAISAWHDRVTLVFRHQFAGGVFGLRYHSTYDGGDNWNFGQIYWPQPGEPSVITFDMTNRGGFGIAAVYILENGLDDQVWIRKKDGYTLGGVQWDPPELINDLDPVALPSREIDIDWVATIDGNRHNFRFGTVYSAQPGPTFDRHEHCEGDITQSGTVNIDDLLAIIGTWGACPDCDVCIGDIAPFSGNCAVDINDLLEVIGHWGPCS